MPKPKKEKWVQVRISDKQHKAWNEFVNENEYFEDVSKLVRFAVEEYIERFGKNQESISKSKELMNTNKLIDELQKQRAEYMTKINELMTKSAEKEKIKENHDIKGKLLTLLEKVSLKSEDIAKILGIAEPYIIDLCNSLINQSLLKLNKKMEYEVITNGNIK